MFIVNTNSNSNYIQESSKPSPAQLLASMEKKAWISWEKVLGKRNWDSLLSYFANRTDVQKDIYSKVLKRQLPVNKYRMKSSQPNDEDITLCSTCQVSTESLEHFLFECSVAKQLWKKVKNFVEEILDVNMPTITLADIVCFFPDLHLVLAMDPTKAKFIEILHASALEALWEARRDVQRRLHNSSHPSSSKDNYMFRPLMIFDSFNQIFLWEEKKNAPTTHFSTDRYKNSAYVSLPVAEATIYDIFYETLKNSLSNSPELCAIRQPTRFSTEIKHSSFLSTSSSRSVETLVCSFENEASNKRISLYSNSEVSSTLQPTRLSTFTKQTSLLSSPSSPLAHSALSNDTLLYNLYSPSRDEDVPTTNSSNSLKSSCTSSLSEKEILVLTPSYNQDVTSWEDSGDYLDGLLDVLYEDNFISAMIKVLDINEKSCF